MALSVRTTTEHGKILGSMRELLMLSISFASGPAPENGAKTKSGSGMLWLPSFKDVIFLAFRIRLNCLFYCGSSFTLRIFYGYTYNGPRYYQGSVSEQRLLWVLSFVVSNGLGLCNSLRNPTNSGPVNAASKEIPIDDLNPSSVCLLCLSSPTLSL